MEIANKSFLVPRGLPSYNDFRLLDFSLTLLHTIL